MKPKPSAAPALKFKMTKICFVMPSTSEVLSTKTWVLSLV